MRCDVTFMVQVQKEDGTFQIEPMNFHETPDGWTWTLARNSLDHLGVSWRAFMIRNALRIADANRKGFAYGHASRFAASAVMMAAYLVHQRTVNAQLRAERDRLFDRSCFTSSASGSPVKLPIPAASLLAGDSAADVGKKRKGT